jgi:hypothetical protein
MRSEKIANEIMSKLHEEVKSFLSGVISHRRSMSFGEIEDAVSELSRSFSKRLADGALEAIGNGYVGRTIECDCGGAMEYHSDRRWQLISLNGRLEIYRSYYYCRSCNSSKVPLDEQLCLAGKHQSIGVREKMALMAVSEPFTEAVKRLEELTGVVVSGKEEQLESEEIGKEVGMQADAELEDFWSQGGPERDIEPEVRASGVPYRLYITADGTIVPTDEVGKEVKIGSIFQTPLAKDALASHIRYTGGIDKAEYFGKKLYILAVKRGLRTAYEIVFIGDGAPWIWKLASQHFPEAVQIVDWYHAKDHLWVVGRLVFGEGTQAAHEWVQQQLDRLMGGKVEEVIAALSELSSVDSESSDVMDKIHSNITYFTNNKDRMRYNEYVEKGYHIGSGTVESACKHVVGQRLKQAGMRWSVEGADAILQLRILRKNGEWHKFWNNRRLAA